MKRFLLFALPALALAGLAAPRAAPAAVPVLTEAGEVARHVGRTVTLVGRVSNTRIPQILGVDVASDSPDLRGRRAQATGILERYEVTAAQVEEMDRTRVAHRGAGVFYRLWDEQRRAEAQVRERR